MFVPKQDSPGRNVDPMLEYSRVQCVSIHLLSLCRDENEMNVMITIALYRTTERPVIFNLIYCPAQCPVLYCVINV